MKILTRADAARFLLEHDHFAILSHRRPDGDTVGSSAALCRGLRLLGKTAHVLVNKEVTPRFAWLHEGLTKPWVEEGDTVVSVDVAHRRRADLPRHRQGDGAVAAAAHGLRRDSGKPAQFRRSRGHRPPV